MLGEMFAEETKFLEPSEWLHESTLQSFITAAHAVS